MISTNRAGHSWDKPGHDEATVDGAWSGDQVSAVAADVRVGSCPFVMQKWQKRKAGLASGA